MKAIVIHKHGDPSVLRYTDVPEPALRHNEALVRVRACALNHLDLWVRRGLPGVAIPLPHIPGSDVAGEVAKVGPEVSTVHVGQKVVLAPGVTCGKCTACVAGQDNHCRNFTNLGYMIDGGCAEYVRVPEVNCLPYPENLDWPHAAAVPLVFLTAWHMLVNRAQLQPGEIVLVLAAGSGVGSAAVQVAKFFGARVIATAGTDEKLAKARELGADEVSTTSSCPFRRKSAASPTIAASMSSSSTSAPPHGITASKASLLAAVWSPAAPPLVTTPNSTSASSFHASSRSSAPTWAPRTNSVPSSNSSLRDASGRPSTRFGPSMNAPPPIII